MRIRKRQKLAQHYTKVIALILIPIVIIGLYAGGVLVLLSGLTSFIYDIDPDAATADFYDLDEINKTSLSNMAYEYSIRQEKYHLPINISQPVIINASSGDVVQYQGHDNGALFTGYSLAAESLRYANLTDGSPEKQQCYRILKKLITGMSMLLAVPNGGLGPEYPGQTLARFYAPPHLKNNASFSWMWSDHVKHFNGTGIYSQWRIRLYTSKDELGGYLFGIAAALKYVDDEWAQGILKLVIGQLMEGFLDSFWQEIHGDGTPSGAHLQPPAYPQWKLLLTKMATIAYPEKERYHQLYNYYLGRELYRQGACQLADADSINNYYGLPFEHNVILGLLLVEENQELRDLWIDNYEKSYDAFKGHRNAYFNAVYLAANRLRTTEPAFNISRIRWDVMDQLWRFNTSGLLPFDDSYGGKNYSVARSELAETDSSWAELDPNVERIRNHPLTNLYSWLWEGENALMDNIINDRYTRPATVDMMRPSLFIWGRNPFLVEGNYSRWHPLYKIEEPDASFTLPYWILRTFNYL